ncbi:ABC transporter substrate-binding protein [Actinomycetospora corticicola]|uniref:Peptide/nickel transport system substrate-binding protein n=1 Tax=Actinomycetospora corticicola TaxID=663602 RepID=A0A7Y9J6F5_9PSEU|nr:peptide/nickel transport system substrate-binding protein [Actinomycetospora corticicola]
MPPLTPTGGTTRRRFLQIGTALAGSAALAACSSGPAAPAVGTPRPGGTLRAAFAGSGATETLDPHTQNLYAELARAKMLYDKLAEYGSDLSVVPRLAERFEPSADQTRWRVPLRAARFHDGRPVRAADVLASYARILGPTPGMRGRSGLATLDLPNCRAIDDRTVEFALKAPYAEFPNATAALGTAIVPEGATDFDRAPVGSGPFRFESFEPGRRFRVVRNPEYWEGAPLLDAVELLVSNDEAARVNALLGRQVEYAHDLSPTTAAGYADRVVVTRLPRSSMQSLAMKVDRPPFDRPEVRQAMYAMVDREEMVRTLLAGSGTVGNDLYGKGFRYYADDIPQRTYDPDRARALVRAAGLEGVRIPLDTAAAGSGMVEAASVLRDQAARVGLTLDVVTGNASTYYSDVRDEGVLAVYRSGALPIESHISQRLLSTSATNFTQWRRPAFDALYAQAQATGDDTARTGLYRQMQQQLHDDGGFLVWGFSDFLVGSDPRVGGIDPTAPANTLDWARFDRVWLA